MKNRSNYKGTKSSYQQSAPFQTPTEILYQHDGTEEGIANRLVTLGVPKDHIVLAFHAPYKRPYTGFATN